MQGPIGQPGNDGLPGRDCEQQPDYSTGILLVKHSQSSIIPECESNHAKLWEGFSLLYIEGNEKSHNQDLGTYVFGFQINMRHIYYQIDGVHKHFFFPKLNICINKHMPSDTKKSNKTYIFFLNCFQVSPALVSGNSPPCRSCSAISITCVTTLAETINRTGSVPTRHYR